METTAAFAGFRCMDCGASVDPDTTGSCPDCTGPLEPTYDADALADAIPTALDAARDPGLAGYAPVLPFPADSLVTAGEGATPVLACPSLGAQLGVDRVLVKDEGRNGTGGVADRAMALAVAGARAHGADDVALPTTGNGGQAAAAYASRAGLDSHSFAPSRMPFANKAMINVHGGDMQIVGGRYADAAGAFADAIEEDWYSLAPFDTPYRHEGLKTLAYELVADCGGAPDAVVYPTAHGIGPVGLHRGFRELAAAGQIDSVPRLYAAQARGCAPVANAWANGGATHDPVEHPDTICGALEVPDPDGGPFVLDALAATGGGAVATDDEALLEAAVDLSGTGVATSATGGAAVSGATALADDGAFADDETVVLVNTATANREADILRSHLMSKGV
ncbi:MAG: pyridoxal-phosphate dependent enzyme [Halovenus sp.]